MICSNKVQLMILNHYLEELKLEVALFVQDRLIVFNLFKIKQFLVDHILWINKEQKTAQSHLEEYSHKAV